MESEWRQDEKKMKKKKKKRSKGPMTAEHIGLGKPSVYSRLMSTSICPDIGENKWFKYEEEKKKMTWYCK